MGKGAQSLGISRFFTCSVHGFRVMSSGQIELQLQEWNHSVHKPFAKASHKHRWPKPQSWLRKCPRREADLSVGEKRAQLQYGDSPVCSVRNNRWLYWPWAFWRDLFAQQSAHSHEIACELVREAEQNRQPYNFDLVDKLRSLDN